MTDLADTHTAANEDLATVIAERDQLRDQLSQVIDLVNAGRDAVMHVVGAGPDPDA